MQATQLAVDHLLNQPLSKPLKVFATRGVVANLGEQTTSEILIEILKLFPDHPYDMFVIEDNGEHGCRIRLAGYHLITNTLDEKTVIASFVWRLAENYFFKVDEYDDHFCGTMLLPEEY